MLRIQIIAWLFSLIICTVSYAIDIHTCYILTDAIVEGNVDKVKDLIDSGLDPNAECSSELEGIKSSPFTPLEFAVMLERQEIVKILLEKGANPNKKNQGSGTTPLMIAAAHGQSDIVRILLDGGTDPRIKDEYGLTALDYAVAKNNTEIAKLLIEKKPSENELKSLEKERERLKKEIERLESITTSEEKIKRAQMRQEKEYNVLYEKLFGANNRFECLLKKLSDPAVSSQKRNIIEHILVGVLMEQLVNSAIILDEVVEDDKGEKHKLRSWIKVKTEDVLDKSRTGEEKRSKLKKEYYMMRDNMFAAYFFHEKYPSDKSSNREKDDRHAVSLIDLRNYFETNKCYLEKDEYEAEDNFLFWLGKTDFRFDNLGVMGWQELLIATSSCNLNDKAKVYLQESSISAEKLGAYLVLMQLVFMIQDNGIKLSKDKNNLYFKLAHSTLKCNTWESRKENAILGVYGKPIQTSNHDRKRQNNRTPL